MEARADPDHELRVALRILFALAGSPEPVHVLRHEYRKPGYEPAPAVVQEFEAEFRTAAGIRLVAGSLEGQYGASHRRRLLLWPRPNRRPGTAHRQRPCHRLANNESRFPGGQPDDHQQFRDQQTQRLPTPRVRARLYDSREDTFVHLLRSAEAAVRPCLHVGTAG